MDEEEAKTKWCPFTRMQTLADAMDRAGQDGKLDWPLVCIGSKCMAWRPTVISRLETSIAQQRPIGDGWYLDVDNGWFRYVDAPAGGFCGLAGAA